MMLRSLLAGSSQLEIAHPGATRCRVELIARLPFALNRLWSKPVAHWSSQYRQKPWLQLLDIS